MEEIVTKRKCPHCGLGIEIVIEMELEKTISVRVRGHVPAVERRLQEAREKLTATKAKSQQAGPEEG